jgi:hypothetical protein
MLTERDREIVVTLTNRVKVLAIGQIHRAWWLDANLANTRRRIHRLCIAGWLLPVRVLSKDIDLNPVAPLRIWAPKEPEPDWSCIIRMTSTRWRSPLKSMSAVVGTAQAARHFGGQARHPRVSEGTHDLFLAGVYLRLIAERSDDAVHWMGEGQLVAAAGGGEGGVPDALIQRPDCPIAIEVVGESYTPTKLRAFHAHCDRQNWRYELW